MTQGALWFIILLMSIYGNGHRRPLFVETR
jgi:hypothetical protein